MEENPEGGSEAEVIFLHSVFQNCDVAAGANMLGRPPLKVGHCQWRVWTIQLQHVQGKYRAITDLSSKIFKDM